MAAAVVVLSACLLWPPTARTALVYKNYIVQQDSGMDILCAPYTVQPGDWVIKVLKLRGEIASQDFPYFLQIFARINPHVKDVNRIRPGQQIFIPLREMPTGTYPAQQSGLVTIPFVDLSSKATVSLEAAAAYRVRPRDSISKLVASRYGRYGSADYQEGIRQLQALNPQIKDLDLIFVDQVIFLPTQRSRSAPVEVLASAPVTTRAIPRTPAPLKKDFGDGPGGGSSDERSAPSDVSPLSEAAAMMEASLLDKGTYIFPGDNNRAVRIDLSKTPVIDLPEGQKILLSGEKPIEDADLAAIKTQWKHFRQLKLPANASLEQVLDAVLDTPEKGAPRQKTVQLSTGGATFSIRPKWLLNGPDTEMNPIRHICITPIDTGDQRTPSGVVRFLAGHGIRIREVIRGGTSTAGRTPAQPQHSRQSTTLQITASGHRQLVADLLEALGYTFTRNVAISFPYAGIEVKAMSNLVTTRSGNPLFIDFGDLFGDAFSAITNTGFNIIQVTAQDDLLTVIDTLMTALDEPVSAQPTFLAANRPEQYNTRIGIPGKLMGGDTGERTLITTTPIALPVSQLLNDQQVRIIIVQTPDRQTPAATQQDLSTRPDATAIVGAAGPPPDDIVLHKEVSQP
ncbi:MAG: LysM peptidoglycan-binding domain-containing protein [Pseudomonadota bacterium]